MAQSGGMHQHNMLNYIIDVEDEDIDDPSLHIASFVGNLEKVQRILQNTENKCLLSAQIRPFLSTPLRLAATAGHVEIVEELLGQGAEVDALDIKAQSPLFVALVNQHFQAARVLLEHGANPNGNLKNLCSPLAILCQRGMDEGIKLLCEYGADTEDIIRIMADMPGLPISICATYHHLRSFATLLLHGAAPDLSKYRDLDLRDFVYSSSVPHSIIKYKNPVEYLYLYREFGGNLKLRDSRGETAAEISEDAPALDFLKRTQDVPLSLLSQSRLAVRKSFQNKLHLIPQLGIGEKLLDVLLFKTFNPSDFNLDNQTEVVMYKTLVETCSSVDIVKPSSKATVWRKRLNQTIDLALSNLCHTEEKTEEKKLASHDLGTGPPPPPPPARPVPPRPKFFRFPSAEGLKKNHFSGI